MSVWAVVGLVAVGVAALVLLVMWAEADDRAEAERRGRVAAEAELARTRGEAAKFLRECEQYVLPPVEGVR